MEEKKPANNMNRKNSVSTSNGITTFGSQQQKPIKAESLSIVKDNNTTKDGISNNNTERSISSVGHGKYKIGRGKGKNSVYINVIEIETIY